MIDDDEWWSVSWCTPSHLFHPSTLCRLYSDGTRVYKLILSLCLTILHRTHGMSFKTWSSGDRVPYDPTTPLSLSCLRGWSFRHWETYETRIPDGSTEQCRLEIDDERCISSWWWTCIYKVVAGCKEAAGSRQYRTDSIYLRFMKVTGIFSMMREIIGACKALLLE